MLDPFSIFDSVWGWAGAAGIIVIGAIAIGYLFPQLRVTAVAVAGVAIAIAAIYTKGSKDRAALEQKRKETTVKRIQDKYQKIDERKTKEQDVYDRLKKGTF